MIKSTKLKAGDSLLSGDQFAALSGVANAISGGMTDAQVGVAITNASQFASIDGNAYTFDTIDNLQNLLAVGGTQITTSQLLEGMRLTLTQSGRAGTFLVTKTDYSTNTSIDTQRGIYVALGDDWYAKRVDMSIVSVTWFGAVGSGDESTKIIQACRLAEMENLNVLIPLSTFTVADGTNGYTRKIHGANTVLTGRITNHAGFIDVIVNGSNQSERQITPEISPDSSPKLLWKQASTQRYLFERKGNAYVMVGFVKNKTTVADSLATTYTDANRERMNEVRNVVWTGVYQHNATTTSGTWGTLSLAAGWSFANVIPSNNSARAITAHTTTQNGAYLEFVTKPKNGIVNVALLAGTGASTSAEIYVDEVLYATISPPATASNTFKVYGVYCAGKSDTDSVTIKIINTDSASKTLTVIGVNFYELKDWRGTQYDSFAYYRHTTNFADYLTQSSSNDAVIQEYNSQTYGVAYHGGESNIVSTWLVDGVTPAQSDDEFIIGNSVRLKTSCSVDWSGVGGGSVDVETEWNFADGKVYHETKFSSSDLTVREVYAHMFGTNEAFSEIVYPKYIDLSLSADDSRNNVGRSNRITLKNPTTGQTYTGITTLYDNEQNRYGGLHVWKKVGQYHKVYYGKVLGGKYDLRNLTCTCVHQFE